MSNDAPAEWKSKVAFMRAEGITSAKWSTVLDPIGCKNIEVLSEAVLGPMPAPVTDDDDLTQPSISPQERERRERLEKRALAARASGGPVRRLDVGD